MSVKIKRIYDDVSDDDGVRVLVDRVWPRGVSKEKAQLDDWLKEIGPSTELRKWFNHDPGKYDDFKESYKKELQEGKQKEALDKLKEMAQDTFGTVTLLFAAKDEENNQATVLKELLND